MITVRSMTANDIPAVRALVEATDGLGFKSWESDPVLARCLSRCDGLSQVATDKDGALIGCVFIGEGLMGFVHHLAVAPEARGRLAGTTMVRRGLNLLFKREHAARRIYITVLSSNAGAQRFWESFGAERQADGALVLFTMDLGEQKWLDSDS